MGLGRPVRAGEAVVPGELPAVADTDAGAGDADARSVACCFAANGTDGDAHAGCNEHTSTDAGSYGNTVTVLSCSLRIRWAA